MIKKPFIIFSFMFLIFSCGGDESSTNEVVLPQNPTIITDKTSISFDDTMVSKSSSASSVLIESKNVDSSLNISSSDGFEISVNSKISEEINLYLNYSYIDSIDGRGQRLINIPKDSGELALTYNSSFNLSGSLTIKYNGSEIGTYGNLDSWSRADINLFYKLNNFSEVYFRVENLLDKNYQQVFGYGTPDRSGLVGVKVNF